MTADKVNFMNGLMAQSLSEWIWKGSGTATSMANTKLYSVEGDRGTDDPNECAYQLAHEGLMVQLNWTGDYSNDVIILDFIRAIPLALQWNGFSAHDIPQGIKRASIGAAYGSEPDQQILRDMVLIAAFGRSMTQKEGL